MVSEDSQDLGRFAVMHRVCETNNPSDGREPFLLVFRTSHVVTAVHEPTLASTFDTASSGGSTGFSSIWPAAHRIVTDAGGSSPGLPGGFLP